MNGFHFRIYLRALREVRPFWPHLGLVLLLGLAGLPLGLIAPVPMMVIVDSVIGGAPLPWPLDRLSGFASPLSLGVGLSLAVAVLVGLHQFCDWLFREWTAEKMVLGFRARMFRHAMTLPVGEGTSSHDLAHRIAFDSPALQWTALYGAIPLIVSLTMLVGTLAVTWSISPGIAIVALLAALPMIGVIYLNHSQMRRRWHDVKERDSNALSVINESFHALRVVTTFGQENRQRDLHVDHSWGAFRARLRTIAIQGAIGGGMNLSIALGTAAILVIGVTSVQSGAMTVGTLVLVIGYVTQLYAPIQHIGSHLAGQQQALVSAERAFAILDRAPAVTEKPGARPVDSVTGEIRLQGVSFGYPNRKPVLDGVDLTIRPGESIGIVGRTGAGKTTLLNLIMRMADPTEGRVLLDGLDLRDLRLADLRRQFSVVNQDATLFSGSMAENIAYGRPDAGRAEIEAAARAANAHDFIMALPRDYDTPVGDKGASLSGGERQRLSLARAFLRDAPILVLDEPTSAVDSGTESAIVASIEKLMQGRTTLMIAHRLSTLRSVDRILRLGEGGIEEVTLAQLQSEGENNPASGKELRQVA